MSVVCYFPGMAPVLPISSSATSVTAPPVLTSMHPLIPVPGTMGTIASLVSSNPAPLAMYSLSNSLSNHTAVVNHLQSPMGQLGNEPTVTTTTTLSNDQSGMSLCRLSEKTSLTKAAQSYTVSCSWHKHWKQPGGLRSSQVISYSFSVGSAATAVDVLPAAGSPTSTDELALIPTTVLEDERSPAEEICVTPIDKSEAVASQPSGDEPATTLQHESGHNEPAVRVALWQQTVLLYTFIVQFVLRIPSPSTMCQVQIAAQQYMYIHLCMYIL